MAFEILKSDAPPAACSVVVVLAHPSNNTEIYAVTVNPGTEQGEPQQEGHEMVGLRTATHVKETLEEELGIVGWLLVLIILGVIFAIWLIVQFFQAIF